MAQLYPSASRIIILPRGASLEETQTYLNDLANQLAMLAKESDFVVNGNIDANNIRANSIETKNLKAGSITADTIAAGAVTADKITVSELSAISADLGHITAGLIEAVTIIGSLISTKPTGQYPNIELSSISNLLTASLDADNSIAIMPELAGAPAISFKSNGVVSGALFSGTDNRLVLSSSENDLVLTGRQNLVLGAGSGDITVPGWSELRSIGNGQTLQQALDSLSARITALGG